MNKKLKAKLSLAIVGFFVAATAFAGVRVFNSSSSDLGTLADIKCSSNVTCAVTGGQVAVSVVGLSSGFTGSIIGDGGDPLYGFLINQVAATATTITAAQCGSTFYNTGAVVINLPDGTAGLVGCRLTFITGNASNFDVNPGNSDQILVLTNAAGDAIRNATLGNTVTLQYGATNQWFELGAVGTWTDIN